MPEGDTRMSSTSRYPKAGSRRPRCSSEALRARLRACDLFGMNVRLDAYITAADHCDGAGLPGFVEAEATPQPCGALVLAAARAVILMRPIRSNPYARPARTSLVPKGRPQLAGPRSGIPQQRGSVT